MTTTPSTPNQPSPERVQPDIFGPEADLLKAAYQLGEHGVKDGQLLPVLERLNSLINQRIAAVLDEVEELIGEDELRPLEGPKRNGIDQGLRRSRNKLRQQQRRALASLRAKYGDGK